MRETNIEVIKRHRQGKGCLTVHKDRGMDQHRARDAWRTASDGVEPNRETDVSVLP